MQDDEDVTKGDMVAALDVSTERPSQKLSRFGRV